MKIEKNINSQPHNWLIHHIYIKSLKKNLNYISGNVIDIGCGKKPFYNIIASNCDSYIGLEHQKTLHGFAQVDVVGDALKLPFSQSCADTIISFQVMEHIPEPGIFLKEIYRILKPGGHCLLMTPFMWGEHEIPNDYFRYTRYGLEYLAKKNNFRVIQIVADTGYLSKSAIQFNYFLFRYAKGMLKYLFIPFFWCNQYFAYIVEKLFKDDGSDTAAFTTVLQKPTNNKVK